MKTMKKKIQAKPSCLSKWIAGLLHEDQIYMSNETARKRSHADSTLTPQDAGAHKKKRLLITWMGLLRTVVTG
jgi:hypothetical protein